MDNNEEPDPNAGKMAPPWLREMRKSRVDGHRADRPNGFYVNYQKFAAVHVARGDDTLIVAFDNLSSVNDESLEREAWGDKFYGENNWSSLGIISFDANWYRDEVLFDYLEGLRDQGFSNASRTWFLPARRWGHMRPVLFANCHQALLLSPIHHSRP